MLGNRIEGKKFTMDERLEILKEWKEKNLTNYDVVQIVRYVYSVHSYFKEDCYRLQGYLVPEELIHEEHFYFPPDCELVYVEGKLVMFFSLEIPTK